MYIPEKPQNKTQTPKDTPETASTNSNSIQSKNLSVNRVFQYKTLFKVAKLVCA